MRAVLLVCCIAFAAVSVEAVNGLVGACKSKNYTTVDIDPARCELRPRSVRLRS